jgi:membrane-associated phospholipid phosphatase
MFAARAFWRPLTIPAAGYALIIYVTSVASGWHYATDGIVGAVLATAIYAWLARRARQSASPQGAREAAAKPALA